MATGPSTDEAIDTFVARMNALSVAIRPISAAPWIGELEVRLPRPFPPSFRSLVTRYAFAAFDLGPAHLFANEGEPTGEDELARRIFADRTLATVLLQAGYVQIGMSVDGAFYDPVCLDMNERGRGGEYPLVRMDHEVALQFDRIRVVRRIARSFLQFIS
ncbi:hypothetical protein [Anaeromyxobacter oryzae]|uniref:Knr4/Smi1-like domain-containing protein n=1 Tax=Anaeromyxobacter oryzae TaxID=2918170 RepID=A0ABM7X2I7_9BACT|nr:hypothetical protein [Anaeromyxobacter oryzae]BDG05997.1 hypothetical protein AMOR_49930 [Anaeromyxobacter oryzae]